MHTADYARVLGVDTKDANEIAPGGLIEAIETIPRLERRRQQMEILRNASRPSLCGTWLPTAVGVFVLCIVCLIVLYKNRPSLGDELDSVANATTPKGG